MGYIAPCAPPEGEHPLRAAESTQAENMEMVEMAAHWASCRVRMRRKEHRKGYMPPRAPPPSRRKRRETGYMGPRRRKRR